MEYIVIRYDEADLSDLTVEIQSQASPWGISIGLVEPRTAPILVDGRLSNLALVFGNMLCEIDDEETRAPEYHPPSAWLMAMIYVMWHGIEHGLAWFQMETLLHTTLSKLQRLGISPSVCCWDSYPEWARLQKIFGHLQKRYHDIYRRPADIFSQETLFRSAVGPLDLLTAVRYSARDSQAVQHANGKLQFGTVDLLC